MNDRLTSHNPSGTRDVSGLNEQEAFEAQTSACVPRYWSISIEAVFRDEELRLDAVRFDPSVRLLSQEAHRLSVDHVSVVLGELAEVELPSQFERIWAKDKRHGEPYLNATDLLSLFAIGVPSQPRYLSRQSVVDFESLIIQKDSLLMTCSGTIGRVFHVPARLNGWVATHDLIRIRSKPSMVGYLFAWLTTESARSLILSHTHGGQIDHVTADQVRSVPVPILPKDIIREINRSVLEALRIREEGLTQLEKIWHRNRS